MSNTNHIAASLENIQDDYNNLEKAWEQKNGTKEGFAEWFVSQMMKTMK